MAHILETMRKESKKLGQRKMIHINKEICFNEKNKVSEESRAASHLHVLDGSQIF